MPDTLLTCCDCGAGIDQPNRKGPKPKRCADCRSAYRAATTARWHAAHPDAQKRYTAERTERSQAQRPPRPCPVCGVEFTPKRTRSTYCSDECSRAAYDSPDLDAARRTLARRQASRDAVVGQPMCEQCGTEPRRVGETGRPARFCSHRCMRTWHNRARANSSSMRHGRNNYVHKARAAQYGGSIAGVTGKQWLAILAYYGDRCAYCASPDNLERDHVVPVTRGGGHEPSNVVPACRPCNRSKGDQLLEEWRPGLTLNRMSA